MTITLPAWFVWLLVVLLGLHGLVLLAELYLRFLAYKITKMRGAPIDRSTSK